MPDLQLSTQNTFTVTPTAVIRLFPAGHLSVAKVNVLNLGPGAVWLRVGGDPAVGDILSEKLPPNIADNGVPFYLYIGIIAETTDATVVTRME